MTYHQMRLLFAGLAERMTSKRMASYFYRVSLFLLVAVVFIPVMLRFPALGVNAASNMIQNSSFETTGSGWLSPWYFAVHAGGNGTITQDGSTRTSGTYSARVNITQASSSVWVVQLSQSHLSLVAGQNYTLSFSAKASVNRQLETFFQQSSSPYTTYANRSFSITTSWQRFSYAFAASASQNGTALRFNLAETSGNVWLDDVSLTNNSSTGGFEKGVALTDFIKYWGTNTSGVNSDFNDMAGGNVNWARFELYQSNPLSYFDTAVQLAQSHHIKLLVIVENTYPYRDLGSNIDRSNFKSWLAQMVNRYKYYVKNWEIGNEENLHYEWNIDDSSTSDQTEYLAAVHRYVLHLQDAYQTIKANDATATIFIGGLSEWTVERYMDALMNENVCPYFDVWSFHPYASDPNTVLSRFDSFKAKVAKRSCFQAKPFWVTEIGFNASWSNRTGYVASEQQKADYLSQTLTRLHNDGAQLPIFWYTLRENTSASGNGLEQKDPSTLKATYYPAYYTYKSLTY